MQLVRQRQSGRAEDGHVVQEHVETIERIRASLARTRRRIVAASVNGNVGRTSATSGRWNSPLSICSVNPIFFSRR